MNLFSEVQLKKLKIQEISKLDKKIEHDKTCWKFTSNFSKVHFKRDGSSLCFWKLTLNKTII
jgi:hypothetical protein